MKRPLLLLFASAFSLFSNAQTTVTEKWDNGRKKSEGVFYGHTEVATTASKNERAAKTAGSIKDGLWQYWYENGKLHSEENYKMGAETGTWKTWYMNGTLSSQIDFISGEAIYYYETGKKQSEGLMLKGMLRTATWTGYFENGQKNYQGAYKNGVKDGTWTWWNEKGEETAKEKFQNGVKVSGKSY